MALADAPFYASGPIPTAQSDRHLHGFEEERRQLASFLSRRNQGRFAIWGGQQSGKTSLILSVARQASANRVHIDCDAIWPARPQAFYRVLLDALRLPPPEGALEGPPAEILANLPAPRKALRGVLVLDNAHVLAQLDPRLVEAMNTYIERTGMHLVVTGDMVSIGAAPDAFLTLQPFSEGTTMDFLRTRLQKAGLEFEEEAGSIAYEFTRGKPGLLQALGLRMWAHAKLGGRRKVGVPEVESAVLETLESLPTTTIAPLMAVRGIMKDVLVAMCLHDLTSPTDIATRLAAEPKNIVVLLGRLAGAHRLVDRTARGQYVVHDPLLKHYVRKRFSSPVLR